MWLIRCSCSKGGATRRKQRGEGVECGERVGCEVEKKPLSLSQCVSSWCFKSCWQCVCFHGNVQRAGACWGCWWQQAVASERPQRARAAPQTLAYVSGGWGHFLHCSFPRWSLCLPRPGLWHRTLHRRLLPTALGPAAAPHRGNSAAPLQWGSQSTGLRAFKPPAVTLPEPPWRSATGALLPGGSREFHLQVRTALFECPFFCHFVRSLKVYKTMGRLITCIKLHYSKSVLVRRHLYQHWW